MDKLISVVLSTIHGVADALSTRIAAVEARAYVPGPRGEIGLTGKSGEPGMPGPIGPVGPAGVSFHVGDGPPELANGATGDAYLDTRTGDVYRWLP